MRTFIVSISTLFLAALVIMNPATAGDRLKIYELAESGDSIEFPAQWVEMLPESIAKTGNPRRSSK